MSREIAPRADPLASEISRDFPKLPHLLSVLLSKLWQLSSVAEAHVSGLLFTGTTMASNIVAPRLAQAGYTATEAIQLSKAHRVDTYNSVRTYRRAVARAEQKITQLEHSLRLLVERASACKW
jgi:hypothetical protein